MKIWWEYQCDLNHQWAIFAEDEAGGPEGPTCPIDGQPAVTAIPQRPADRVLVTIVPAAWVADSATGAVARDSEYFIEIASADREKIRRSLKAFSWDEAVKKASVFRRAPWSQALIRWGRIGVD